MARWKVHEIGAVAVKNRVMHRIRQVAPSLAVIAALIATWWVLVLVTHSAIFPTPLQVVTGMLELLRDGTLFDHIGASLFRVAAGFLLALVFAIPLGLWMGWVRGAFSTLNPIFQLLRPISPIALASGLWFTIQLIALASPSTSPTGTSSPPPPP